MTEKEKMLKGLLYDANYDAQLLDERAHAKSLCFSFNHLAPQDTSKRQSILRELFGKTPEHFFVEQPFYCDYGYHIEIGENFFANHNCIILDAAKVIFKNNVFVGPNCSFYTAGHPLDPDQRACGLEYARPITVGNNVWIGGNVVVLPGVTIGDHSVIGAGSVVTHDIPSGVLAVGNPCRIVRSIHSEPG